MTPRPRFRGPDNSLDLGGGESYLETACLAQAHAALVYHHANREEIEADLAGEEAEAETCSGSMMQRVAENCDHPTVPPNPQPYHLMTRKTVEGKIVAFFRRRPHVIAVYVFGSYVRSGVRHAEDVDVAVLYERGHEPDEFCRLQDQEELSQRLGKPADLVILNRVPVVLRMQVLMKGLPLLVQDRSKLSDFMVRTQAEYVDLKRVRRPIEEKLAEAPVLG